MVSVSVELNGLVMDETADGNGIYWCWSALTGWWDGPDVDMALSPKAVQGTTVTSAKNRGRSIVLEGIAYKPDGVALGTDWFTAQETLAEAVDLVDTHALLLVGEPTPKQMYVRRDQPFRCRVIGEMQWLEFQVPLYAPDPVKYGQTENNQTITIASGASSKTETVTNAGNAPVPITARMHGPTEWATLRHVGLSLPVEHDRDVGAGEYMDFDFATKTVLDETATDAYSYVRTSTKWWLLQAGANSVRYERGFTPPAATADCDLTWRDGWW